MNKVIITKQIKEEFEVKQNSKVKENTIEVNPKNFDDVVNYIIKKRQDFYTEEGDIIEEGD